MRDEADERPLRAVRRGRQALGSRFRVHGRLPDTGLDCVGLIAWAYEVQAVSTGYGLRGAWRERIEGGLAELGFVTTSACLPGAMIEAGLTDMPNTSALGIKCIRPGDVFLACVGPLQYHLCLWSGARIIHACAWLRRVVECQWRKDWALESVWRFAG